MNGKNAKVTVGIYKSGASVRVIGECDLIEQDNGHKEEAIYMFESSLMRNPTEEFTEKEINDIVKNVESQFAQHRFTFKVKDRKQANTFIKDKVGGKSWTAVKAL